MEQINGFHAEILNGADEPVEPTHEELTKEVDSKEIEEALSLNERAIDSSVFRWAGKCKVLSRTETVGRFKIKESGSESDKAKAHEELVLTNFRLVLYIAKKFRYRGLDFEDLVQEGYFGLKRAIEKYDYRPGYAFSTYAWWWIRQKVTRAIEEQSRQVRYPKRKSDLARAVGKAQSVFFSKMGRWPTLAELCEEVDESLENVEEALSGRGQAAFSFDAPLTSESTSSTHQDLFPDAKALNPAMALLAKEEFELTEEKLGKLKLVLDVIGIDSTSKRNVDIFKIYYNLQSGVFTGYTLEMVGQQFGITRERTRQVLKIVWNKLKFKYLGELPSLIELVRVHRGNGGGHSEFSHESLLSEDVQHSLNSEMLSDGRKVRGLLNLRPGSKVLKKIRNFFRASPSLINWQPNEEERNDPPKAVVSLVSFAYEHTFDGAALDTLNMWMRSVCACIMMNDLGMDLRNTRRFLSGIATSRMEIFKEILCQHAEVKTDVEDMRLHFRTVMGVPHTVTNGKVHKQGE
jgi:RNA polymerase sigma factor (sigma-70 family)